MTIVKYFEVEKNETDDDVLRKIKIHLKHLNFYFVEINQLMGNKKVLVLRDKSYMDNFIKIEGPGFIIDKLSKRF